MAGRDRDENALQFHISAVRKALGADRALLTTVSGRGYRLLGDWMIQEDRAPTELDVPERAGAAPGSFRTNVPVAASALVGREAAVEQLRDLVSAHRAVTLTGPGHRRSDRSEKAPGRAPGRRAPLMRVRRRRPARLWFAADR
jgi:hypothetical protein